MVFATPRTFDDPQPWMVLNDAEGTSVLHIELVEATKSRSEASSALDDRCTNMEVREYELVVEPEDWHSYWAIAKPQRKFMGGAGVKFKPEQRVSAKSFGFALIDRQSGSIAWVCGCLAE